MKYFAQGLEINCETQHTLVDYRKGPVWRHILYTSKGGRFLSNAYYPHEWTSKEPTDEVLNKFAIMAHTRFVT